jgi:hypothetical protein
MEGRSMTQWSIDELVAELKRIPGLTVDRTRLDPSLDLNVANLADRDLEWDKYGNPVFMPKDPEMVKEIRACWARIDDALEE